MKKIFTVIIAGLLAASSALAFEDKIEIFGEIKSGFLFESRDEAGKNTSYARITNNDGDAGTEEGRIRMGMALSILNFGLRTQFQQVSFKRATGGPTDSSRLKVSTDFAYAYGTVFNSQLKVSAGLLGESPWGSGGFELYKELEYGNGGDPLMGIRVEWKPTFTPQIRGLNIGFVLGQSDDTTGDAKLEFGDLIRESIIGIAWDHPYFGLRFAYRFDRDLHSPAAIIVGEKLTYRFEERLLWNLLPGFQISVNGYCEGVNSDKRTGYNDPTGVFINWLYIHFDPMDFTTGIDTGYTDYFVSKTGGQLLEIRPFFYYKFINNYLIAGLMAGMVMGFNGKETVKDIFYNNWYLEPQVKFNIHNNFYVALVYRYTSTAYKTLGNNEYYTQWFNLRLCFTF
jgi:hypothetical protein